MLNHPMSKQEAIAAMREGFFIIFVAPQREKGYQAGPVSNGWVFYCGMPAAIIVDMCEICAGICALCVLH